MHQYKGALVLPIAVPDQSSAVIPRLVLLLFVRQTRPLGKLKNVPLAAQRLSCCRMLHVQASKC